MKKLKLMDIVTNIEERLTRLEDEQEILRMNTSNRLRVLESKGKQQDKKITIEDIYGEM